MCEFIKDTDCRIIRRNFTLGFCIRSTKYTKQYAWTVEGETCHTSSLNYFRTGRRIHDDVDVLASVIFGLMALSNLQLSINT